MIICLLGHGSEEQQIEAADIARIVCVGPRRHAFFSKIFSKDYILTFQMHTSIPTCMHTSIHKFMHTYINVCILPYFSLS